MRVFPFAVHLLALALPSSLYGGAGVSFAAATDTPRHAQAPHVLVISLDGMKPDYVLHATDHGLTLPTLCRFVTEGSYAEGVEGVVPTLTFPSHTTLMTGVAPAEHGIVSNTVFDPMQQRKGEWYWYFRQVRAQTLYHAAAEAGLVTAAVGWPVTVGAPIDYLIAEFGQAKQVALSPTATTRPADLRERLAISLPPDADGDDRKTAWAIGIIKAYDPNLVLVHLDDLDHEQHAHGAFSPEAKRAIERMDRQVRLMIDAELARHPDATIVMLSDHGFAPADHRVALNRLFVEAGLIRLAPPGVGKTLAVASWDAQAWEAGGTAAIMLRNPNDAAMRRRVKTVLDKAAADPAFGIDRIVDHAGVAAAGGNPDAAFMVDFKPGWATGGGLRGPVLSEAPGTGTHGYMPYHPEMRASFFAMGQSVAKGRDLGLVDMRRIAPTMAQMLGLTLPAAKLPPLSWQRISRDTH